MSEYILASACLLFDEESFSSGGGPPERNLVEGMRWLQSTYTIRLNHRHKLFGHVFSGRYKALLVDGSGDGYLNLNRTWPPWDGNGIEIPAEK